MIWWIWFDRENVQRKREALLAGLMACVPALIVVKILAKLMFRVKALEQSPIAVDRPLWHRQLQLEAIEFLSPVTMPPCFLRWR